eukprot:scaffold2519_cov168-Amphora_coffeaeformis.AAC.35
MSRLSSFLIVLSTWLALSMGFVPQQRTKLASPPLDIADDRSTTTTTTLFQKISKERRQQLGIQDDEDEYDLDFALDNNTDPLISKIIAGSLIVTMIALLTAGVIIPYTTDYGEGVCNPILTGGRCS